jgi:hypothetical protein
VLTSPDIGHNIVKCRSPIKAWCESKRVNFYSENAAWRESARKKRSPAWLLNQFRIGEVRDLIMQLQDDLFGKLSFDLSWTGKIELPFFDQKIQYDLIVECEDDTEIQDFQRAAFRDLLEHKELYIQRAEEAIFQYYLSICDECRERLGPGWDDKEAPIITAPNQLKKLLSKGGVILPSLDEEENVFCLGYDCTWDTSHGVGVRFVDGMVDEVGFQDICL